MSLSLSTGDPVGRERSQGSRDMLVMGDSASSDHSPPLSDNAGGSWHHWEHEISSISGLNLDSTSELSCLVEDKEIAARAVAFVVNSTRKGIVPLCADIANLLRAKRSLEKKVFLLKRENEALRGSTGTSFRTSHSTSPTPPSFSDKSLLHDHGACLQDRSRPCSRCSQCSSTMSSSPKLEKTSSLKGYLHSPTEARASRRSPRAPSSRAPPNGLSTSVTTQAVVHSLTDASCQDSASDVSRGGGGHETCTGNGGQRKKSLPEIISEPDVKVIKVSPKISKQTQCSLLRYSDSPLEEQFIETVRLNSKLAEELGSARKEIEILKGRLKELEMNQLARECWRDQLHVEAECDDPAVDDRPLTSVDSPCSVIVKRHYTLNGSSRSRLHCQFAPVPGSVLYAEPLYGCKCNACEEAIGGDTQAALPHTLCQDLPKFPINSKLQVQLGDHVVIKGERTGRIRYIGHLDKIGQPNMVFVGLELDAPVGRHDGFFNGKRYFFCNKDHGIFMPLHDIVCKVQPKKSTRMEESGRRSSSSHHSSRSDTTHHHHHRHQHSNKLHHSHSFKLTSLRGSSSTGSRDMPQGLTLSQTSLRSPRIAWSTSSKNSDKASKGDNSSSLSLSKSEEEARIREGGEKGEQTPGEDRKKRVRETGASWERKEERPAESKGRKDRDKLKGSKDLLSNEQNKGAEKESDLQERLGESKETKEDREVRRAAEERIARTREEEEVAMVEFLAEGTNGNNEPEVPFSAGSRTKDGRQETKDSNKEKGLDLRNTPESFVACATTNGTEKDNEISDIARRCEETVHGKEEEREPKNDSTVVAKRSQIWRRIEQDGKYLPAARWPPQQTTSTATMTMTTTAQLTMQGK